MKKINEINSNENQEELIRSLRQELEEQKKLYQEKTQELELALNKAREANKSKSRFLAQTSHEIRTPLNIIIGMTDLAMDKTNDPEKVMNYLLKIDSSSRLLLGLINNILDMSDIEENKIKLEKKEFDFKEQMTQLSVLQYQQAKKKKIHFDVQLKGVTEDYLIGDELKTNQILVNILDNAFKFTPAGGTVELQVIQASTSRDHVHMRFIIRDTGRGISEDMQKRLFLPFEQENEDTARKYGGSGLGLAITKNLVDLMGGSIRVESTLNEGSCFIIDIPYDKVESKPTEKPTDSFSKYRAIVISENMEHCHERGIVLENMGISYDTATDSDEAMDMIGEAESEGKPYGICVIDRMIGDVSGIDFIREIRDLFGEKMIIIGAAFEYSDSIAIGLGAGADYMVAKPVFRSTLFDAIMKLSNGEIEAYKHDVEPKYDFKGRRVLLVEDVALNMEVAVSLLNRVGIDVICAENGLEAVQIFQKQTNNYFDCIFMDINMPVMDGYEATRKIRNLPREDAKQVPIYAMTANAFTKDVSEALDVGMNGHIAKPIETDVLYQTLNKCFESEKE